MKSILDPSFRYVPSHATDLRETFQRIRREREIAPGRPVETVVQMTGKRPVPATERSSPNFYRAATSRSRSSA